ncbi:hypothetical protein GCM10023189_15140 [Nibrella saemangeumensis]|uniref:Uncharacterized protein n=1 Tax=Nibrella saemangeumensis TaxID=1084526 RepID=A0ABP8MKT5_9BACT
MDYLADHIGLLARVADASILIPLIALLIRRQYITGELRILAAFVILVFLRNLITEILSAYRIHNIIFYNWFVIFFYLNTAYLYARLLKGRIRQYFIPISCMLLVGLSMLEYDTMLNPKTVMFNSYAHPLSGLFTIVLVLAFYFQVLESLQIPNIKRDPYFWFSSGALLYYTGTLLVYVFSRYTLSVSPEIDMQRQYWSIDCLLSIIFYLFMAVGIWFTGPAGHTRKRSTAKMRIISNL